MSELVRFEAAKQALAIATSIDEVKEIRDKAEAMRAYTKQVGDSHEMQNQCAEIKLRAERRAGEMLGEMEKHKGGRPSENQSHDATSLSNLGITKSQSSRWQQVASLPEKDFEEHVAKTKNNGGELTTASTLKLAKKAKAKAAVTEPTEYAESDDSHIIDIRTTDIKFPCIYADPAWQYGNQKTRGATDNHYPTMPLQDICDLPVKRVAADDSHLHLWTTNAFLFDSMQVMEAWGFTYKSMMLWVKPQIGMGNYWRVSHEFLLLGVRGSLEFADRSVRSWEEHPRGKHSAKPEAFRTLVERVSPGPRLEMFARTTCPGWHSWGNQVSHTLSSI